MKRLGPALALLVFALPAMAGRGIPERPANPALIGRPAPPLALEHWIHSPPLEISELAGKVVLVRWWTDSCPFCAASAPALREWDRKYAPQGLVVIGIFHPKPPGDPSLERMRHAADALGLPFPLALDASWKALRRWWLDGASENAWTSVTFLIDRKGKIRYVHPGGEYHEGEGSGAAWSDHATCRREHRQITQTIERLLAE